MTYRPPKERNERALPFAVGALLVLAMILVRECGLRPDTRSAMSPSIDVFGILIGFLVGVRSLIREQSDVARHGKQSDLADRLDTSFRVALRLSFASLAVSVSSLVFGGLLSGLAATLADAFWLGSVGAGGVANYIALRTTFTLLMGEPKKRKSSPPPAPASVSDRSPLPAAPLVG